jgi:hypothetical protein
MCDRMPPVAAGRRGPCFVQAKVCSVVQDQKLKWTDFQNFDESGGFWVKMVKQFKKCIGAAHNTY